MLHRRDSVSGALFLITGLQLERALELPHALKYVA
jgi:hypothetical protein